MCAFTASGSEKMESLSAGGPGWQVLRGIIWLTSWGRVFHPCWPEDG